MELRRLAREFESSFHANNKDKAQEIYQLMKEKFGEDNSQVDLARRRLSIM